MTTRANNVEPLLAAVQQHLTEAERQLGDDVMPAAMAARAEIRAALATHEAYSRQLGHDLRNALTSISGQTQLLERQLTREELDRERITVLVRRISDAIEQANLISHRLAG